MSKLSALAFVSSLAVAGFASAASTPYSAIGVVQQADPAARTVTLAHPAVPSLNWPASTAQFSVLEPGLFERLPTGQEVAFEFVQQPNGWRIVNAIPLAQSASAAPAQQPQAPGPMAQGRMDMSSMHRMCMDIVSQMENRYR